MKQNILLPLFACIIGSLTLTAQPVKELKKVLELKIPREGGANAASVAWHPVQKKYYAAMAGNAEFFIGVFNTSGTRLNPVSQSTMFDVRGLWYNPATKTLQMNGYNDFGWAEYKLDAKGYPASVKNLHEDMNQPDEQSVGVYDTKEKAIYFFNGEGNVEVYGLDNAEYVKDIELYLGLTEEDDETDNYDVLDEYNNTTVVYTAITGAELGLLNHYNKEIELYNIKTGYLTRKLSLPEDAPVKTFLNFAYANGIYWLFDTEKRIWKGYK